MGEEEEEEEGEKGWGRKIDKEEKGRYLMGRKKCVDEKKERIKKKKKKKKKRGGLGGIRILPCKEIYKNKFNNCVRSQQIITKFS